MFTGLVESVCRVVSARPLAAGMELEVSLDSLAGDTVKGASVAVNGVCLTVEEIVSGTARFRVSPQTLTVSNIGRLRAASMVNIERALRAGEPLGGHLVQGHVDGTATVSAITPEGGFVRMKLAAEKSLFEEIVLRGSVALDSVSLTVSSLDEGGFSVALIPETMESTTLGAAVAGAVVNIETDIIVKAVRKVLAGMMPRGEITPDRLRAMGF
jgi:riboflavin synthase alpha subunit